MGDLLKTMRSSQIFSVTGLPDVASKEASPRGQGRSAACYQVELRGLDVFDPMTMKRDHRDGSDVPCVVPRHRLQRAVLPRLAGVLPRTSAWENLERSQRHL